MPPLLQRLPPSRFLDPALVLLVVLGVSLFFALRGAAPAGRAARAGRASAWAAWATLWALASPTFADPLAAWIEVRGPDLDVALAGIPAERTALVVLAAGMRTSDPSVPVRERLDSSSESRILGAARLFHAHRFGLILLSGGPEELSQGMTDLITSLGVPAERVVRELASTNTRENAAFSARILRERDIDKVVLATSATHLRRSMKDFERVGLHVIPAPVDVLGRPPWGIDDLLPSSGALLKTHRALHEILGRLKP